VRRYLVPTFALAAALLAAVSIVRMQPPRLATNPPATPPVSSFAERVAAAGVVEPSSEEILVGTPVSGIATAVYVLPGERVTKGAPLFELDTLHLLAQLEVRRAAIAAAIAHVATTESQLEDLRRRLEFVEAAGDVVSLEEAARRRGAVDTAAASVREAQARADQTRAEERAVAAEIARHTVRTPSTGDVLQVRLQAGEFAHAGAGSPLVVLGQSWPLHVRVDVDEHEAWRLRPNLAAVGHPRGNSGRAIPLAFVRLEPMVVPKRSLTGESFERVDTRVLQAIYRVGSTPVPLFVGQQLDVFIDGSVARASE
jgi:multidrug efflux pump subunit AcrA (membrane-fusion protein)